MKRFIIISLAWLALSSVAGAQQPLPYKNPKLPVEERVKDLLSRMTPEEKFWQLFMIPGDLGADPGQYRHGIFGFQVSAASAGNNASAQLLQYNASENALLLARKVNTIQRYFVEQTRLGIPIMAFDECLHGLVRQGATAFPQAIGLAASFDTSMMRKVASAIAIETKARGIRDVLSPVVNIASDVRWGRTEETYGEDPFLAAAMAVAFVSPFEQMGIITTPKHFVANVGDGGRDSYPIHFNERYMEETHFPPFRAAIEKGGSRSIMTAYNSYDGKASTANSWLLMDKLKKEWGFGGFVISDAGATGGTLVLHNTAKDYPASAADAITNGLDVIFQTDYNHYRLFQPPFLDGAISLQRIDDAVARVLRAKFELGLFEQPYVSEELAQAWVNNTTHKAIAKEAALKSIVLLKNENQVLPISKKIRSIAVLGKDAVEARLGGYSGPGNGKVSVLEGIREKLGKTVQVNYAEGANRNETYWEPIPNKYLQTVWNGKTTQGLTGEYFSGLNPSGKASLTRLDQSVNFHWTLFSPDPSLPTDHYSVKWTGKLVAPVSGRVKIGLEGNDGYRLYINQQLVVDNWGKQGYHTRLVDYVLEKGKEYAIQVEFYEAAANGRIRLVWDYGVEKDQEAKIRNAVAVAKASDIAVIVAGIHEGEFQDRAMLNLPGHQEELIKAVAATGKPVVVVLVGGSAITMGNWLDKVDGVLDVWYPGEEGGHAVAAVLFGDYNPAGRLPITFPQHEAQLPLVYSHKPTGRGDDYHNLSGQPLFPFGFGLSYTSFEYSNIRLSRHQMGVKDTALVSCTIRNTGRVKGEEVVQLYIKDILASVSRPVQELRGFQRIELAPGESRTVHFAITPEMLEMLDKDLKRVVEPGTYRIMIGSSSRDLWLKTNLEVVE